MLHILRTSTKFQLKTVNLLRNYSVINCSSLYLHKEVKNLNEIQKRNFSYQSYIEDIWNALSNSTPVAYLQNGLIYLHDTTGLPWWATIILSTFILRSFITLPFAVYQNKIISKIELCTLEMPGIAEELKRETAYAIKKFGWNEKQAKIQYQKSLQKQWSNLIVRDNCHPAKTSILMWVQIPLWICQSVAIRNLVYMLPTPTLEAQIAFTELCVGGFGWIPNLIEVDNSYILPVFLGLINLGIIEIQNMVRTRPSTKLHKYATNFFRGFSILMIPIATQVPSCLCIYWVSSSFFGLSQNLFLLSPKVRRIMGIPKTSTELEEPYKHIKNSIQKKFL